MPRADIWELPENMPGAVVVRISRLGRAGYRPTGTGKIEVFVEPANKSAVGKSAY